MLLLHLSITFSLFTFLDMWFAASVVITDSLDT